MTFEPRKYRKIIISRKRKPTKIDLYFGNTKLTEVDDEEILRVKVDKLTRKKKTNPPGVLPPGASDGRGSAEGATRTNA